MRKGAVLGDAQWTELKSWVETCCPKGRTQLQDLRRAISAEIGSWRRTAQVFIRRARLDVRKRLLARVQERGVPFGMVSLDGTGVRAHQKVAGVNGTD